MARRMYDLDNGTEDIKVKEITAVNSVKAASLTIGIGRHNLSSSGGARFGGFVRFPLYSIANRPTLTGEIGSVIYDTDLAKLILWNGTAWVNLDGTALS